MTQLFLFSYYKGIYKCKLVNSFICFYSPCQNFIRPHPRGLYEPLWEILLYKLTFDLRSWNQELFLNFPIMFEFQLGKIITQYYEDNANFLPKS